MHAFIYNIVSPYVFSFLKAQTLSVPHLLGNKPTVFYIFLVFVCVLFAGHRLRARTIFWFTCSSQTRTIIYLSHDIKTNLAPPFLYISIS